MDTICLDFVNSEFRDFRGRWVRDDLQQPGRMELFLARWGLQLDRPFDQAALPTFIALRALLRSLIEALAEGRIAEPELAALNAVLLKMSFSRRLVKDSQGYQLAITPLRKDWDWVQAEIAASFAHMLAYHYASRLKV